MELQTFDAFTRRLSGTASSRRQTLRALGNLLLSGALGGVAARLGLAEDAAAKANKHGKRHHGQRQSGGSLHAAGKKRNKHKSKHHHKPKDPPPLPPGCEHCTECQMCQDGACVPDPDLERVRCAGSGAACGYCQGGICTAADIPPCDDGTCPRKGYCCSGERFCSDPELPSGYYCIVETACCDGQKKCGDQCLPLSSCCDADPPQCGRCDEAICSHGQYQCITKCCTDEKTCSDGTCVARGTCCADEKPCFGGCIAKDACCPDAPSPDCKCDTVVCDHGEYVCRGNHDCPPGGQWNPERCRCEFCEEDCGDPWNDLCRWPGCQDGEQCVQGICQAACPDPRFPQLSCVKDAYNGSVRCYCGFPGEITFNCGNNVCGCGPGSGVCCDPNNIHTPHCPEACYCPGA